MIARVVACCLAAAASVALAGCSGEQSALAPTGPQAHDVAILFWVMTAGGGIILLGVIVLTAIAIGGRKSWRQQLGRRATVILGGILFPVAVLTVLLAYGLVVTGEGANAGATAEPLRIAVVGERWWWRIIYTGPDGRHFESANEIRIPADRPVELTLTSADVIHSLWVPRLAGKLDMIPGRTTKLTLVADEPGVSRGQCAEYCGGAHALMSFYVVAMSTAEYSGWLDREAAPARKPSGPALAEGERLFLTGGCNACHTIRGTTAAGTLGPDLTHVGGRMSLAAGTLPTSPEAFARWITDNQHIKPQNLMPPFGIFTDRELASLSAYLASLR